MPYAQTRARRRTSSPEARLRKDAQKLGGLALETLKKIMSGEGPETIRLAAAREVLDRGHGRPKLGAAEVEPDGLTVVVKRFTDPPAANDGGADA